MADDQALQGPPVHLAPGSRGRTQIIAPYQPHVFTGYEPNRLTSMPSAPRRIGEAPGPPRVNPRAGTPATGSRTQAPAYQTWRILAEVVHLHLADDEGSRERFVYEQQEAFDAASSTGTTVGRAGADCRLSQD